MKLFTWLWAGLREQIGTIINFALSILVGAVTFSMGLTYNYYFGLPCAGCIASVSSADLTVVPEPTADNPTPTDSPAPTDNPAPTDGPEPRDDADSDADSELESSKSDDERNISSNIVLEERAPTPTFTPTLIPTFTSTPTSRLAADLFASTPTLTPTASSTPLVDGVLDPERAVILLMLDEIERLENLLAICEAR